MGERVLRCLTECLVYVVVQIFHRSVATVADVLDSSR